MRQIMTREDSEKKENRSKLIIGIIIIGLMVFSTAGYAFFQNERTTSSQDKVNYKGLSFIKQSDEKWHVTIQNYEFITEYNLKDTENISGILSLNLLNYQNKPLYFSYDSDKQGVSEIVGNIGRFASRIGYVCLDNCTEDFAMKNCSSDNVIIIKYANESLIKQESNCVYILGENLRTSDAFIFRVLGI